MAITKEKLTREATYDVLSCCSAYVRPKQIQEEFGISPQLQHYYSKTYDLPKWQKAYSVRKKEWLEEFLYDEEKEAQRYIEAAGQMLVIAANQILLRYGINIEKTGPEGDIS